MKFKKINFNNDRWSFKVKDITHIFKNEKQEYLALRIANGIDQDKYDLIIINSDVSGELDKLNGHITNATLIYNMINLTGHPVLFIPRCSKLKPWQNILQPVNHFIDTTIEFEKMLPLIKMFNSKIYLLGITKDLEEDFVNEYNKGFYS